MVMLTFQSKLFDTYVDTILIRLALRYICLIVDALVPVTVERH